MTGTKKITLTKAQIEAMPAAEFNRLIMAAQKIQGTAVVMDRFGNMKYDDPSLAGTYGEELLAKPPHA
jgi:hypothetical protein